MLILHTSDTHLGCAQFDYREREQDVYDAFRELVDTAIKDKVDAVVHAGDIFDIPKPGGTPLLKLGEGVQALAEHGIKFYFTLGEHDISRMTGTPSAYLFHKLGLATYVGGGDPVYHDGLMIAGFHKRRRAEMDGFVDGMKRIDAIARAHEGKKLVVIHQGLSEFHRWAGEMTSNDLPPHFDYYAMGHLHDHLEKRFQHLGGPVCYPGSIDPTPGEGIREFKKGFLLVDMSGQEAAQEWIEIKSSRRQYRFDANYSEIGRRIEEIIEEIRSRALTKKPVVLVNVRDDTTSGGTSVKGVDNAIVVSFLSKLLSVCLHYTWDIADEADSAETLLSQRPTDIHKEMLELASKALGDDDVASFAVNELMPLLEDGQNEEALDLLEKTFETSRFEVPQRKPTIGEEEKEAKKKKKEEGGALPSDRKS